MECGVQSLMGSDDDIGFNWLETTKDICLINLPEPETLNAFFSFKYMLLGHICISFMMMQTYLLQFDCIRFLICFVILIKINDYLTPHFVFDVLHSGTSLPDFYMLLIGSSTCFYITQVTIWLQWEHIFYSNVTFEVGTIIMSHLLRFIFIF